MTKDLYLVKGKRLSLRLMEEGDFPLIIDWRNKDRVKQNFIYREEFTMKGQRAWMDDYIKTGKAVQFMICENDRDYRPVGCVYFRDIDNEEKCAEYGIFIGEDDALGKGYGNETADLACRYAEYEMKLRKLILRVFKFNTPAIKSYEHAGFVQTTELKLVKCSDGTKDDMILMEKKFRSIG